MNKAHRFFLIGSVMLSFHSLQAQVASRPLKLKVEVEAESQSTGYRLQATAPSNSASSQVSVSAYCEFLNAIATADPYSVYDEKIESIERSGEPGAYCYEVIQGKEDAPINFISQNAAMCYNNWLGNVASTSTLNLNSCEAASQLRSNCLLFSLDEADVITNKNSGRGETGASLEGTILGVSTLLAVALGESERETLERNAMEAEDHAAVHQGVREEQRVQGHGKIAKLWTENAKQDVALADARRQYALFIAKQPEDYDEDQEPWGMTDVTYQGCFSALGDAGRALRKAAEVAAQRNDKAVNFYTEYAEVAQLLAAGYLKCAQAEIDGTQEERELHSYSSYLAIKEILSQAHILGPFQENKYFWQDVNEQATQKRGAFRVEQAKHEYLLATTHVRYAQIRLKGTPEEKAHWKEASALLDKSYLESYNADKVFKVVFSNKWYGFYGLWEENAKRHQLLAESFFKHFQIIAIGAEEKREPWWDASLFYDRGSTQLFFATKALEKTAAARDCTDLAACWADNAKQHHALFDAFLEQGNIIARAIEEEVQQCWDAAAAYSESATLLSFAAKTLEKADTFRRNQAADLYFQSVKHSQDASRAWLEHAQAIIAKNIGKEKESYEAAAACSERAAQLFSEAESLRSSSRANMQQEYEEIYSVKEGVDWGSGWKDDGLIDQSYFACIPPRRSGDHFQSRPLQMHLPIQNAEQHSVLAAISQEKAQAEMNGTESEKRLWSEATPLIDEGAAALSHAGDSWAKAVETQMSDENMSKLWRNHAEKYQELAALFFKRVHIIVHGTETEMVSWKRTSEACNQILTQLRHAADGFKKAAEIQRQGNQDEQESAHFYRMSAQQRHASCDAGLAIIRAIVEGDGKEEQRALRVAQGESESAHQTYIYAFQSMPGARRTFSTSTASSSTKKNF